MNRQLMNTSAQESSAPDSSIHELLQSTREALARESEQPKALFGVGIRTIAAVAVSAVVALLLVILISGVRQSDTASSFSVDVQQFKAALSSQSRIARSRISRRRIGSRISRRARSQPSRRPSNSSGCSRRPASRRHRPIASHPTSCCNDSCSGARRPVRRRTPNSEEQQEEWYKCMLNWWINSSLSRRSYLNSCLTPVLFGALLASTGTASADNLDIVRDLASRVGPIVGSALACPTVARSRVQLIVGKFQDAIREASSNDAERGDVSRLFDRYVADGREAVQRQKRPIARQRSARSPVLNNPSVRRRRRPRPLRSPTRSRRQRPMPRSRRPSRFRRAMCVA